MSAQESIKIAFAGQMGSGKTYVAEWLQDRYKCISLRRIGFGDEVKRLVQELWDPPKKDRPLLVNFATSMRAIDPAIWVKRLFAQTDAQPDVNWVCDDLRQDNEIAALHDRGWLLIRIAVPEDIRRQRLKLKYPNDYEDHMSYSEHRTEQDVLNADASLFACTIDTSADNELWCKVVDKVIHDRWGICPSTLCTPPNTPPKKDQSASESDDDFVVESSYSECVLLYTYATIGILGGLWMYFVHDTYV